MFEKKKQKKVVSVKDAFLNMCKFCAYQERTQKEIRQKLFDDYILDEDEREFIIVRLIEENFVNEERFAKTYAGSKFRVKKWGRLKILQALKMQGLSKYCIEQGMKEIEDDDYEKTLKSVIEKKLRLIKEKDPVKKKYALVRYVVSKGYEQDIVWDIVNDLFD
jgi:regulatory protein